MYKLFLVEDDEAIAGEIRRYLETWDFQVRCVRDYKHVLEEFTEFQPQLVLLDIMLPFFNGFH